MKTCVSLLDPNVWSIGWFNVQILNFFLSIFLCGKANVQKANTKVKKLYIRYYITTSKKRNDEHKKKLWNLQNTHTNTIPTVEQKHKYETYILL